MAPLSGKQQREYLKFQNKEAREAAKMGLDEFRKQQLHEIKLKEAAAKANQGLGHKEQVNNAKLKDMGIPPPRMNKQKLGIPTQNPLAGTGMFKQGQRSLPQSPVFQAQGTDTVPAMLTPGEAVIPRAAAQDPKNKKAIKRMVQEGRRANMRDGAVDVRYSDAPGQAKYHADGTSGVPSLAYMHPDVPGSSFMHGTMSVPDFSRGSSAQANYADGTERVFSRYGKGPLKIVSTHDGYPQQYDEEGRGMSEYSITVTDPRINKGRPTNIPSLWEGKLLSEDKAILKALAVGGPYPSYTSIPQAIEAAGQKSESGGAAAPYSQGTYGVVPQQVQSAAGYYNGDTNIENDPVNQTENDKRLLASMANIPYALPALVSPVVTAPLKAATDATSYLANAVGVPRLGRALGIYDKDVTSVEIPSTESYTPGWDAFKSNVKQLTPKVDITGTNKETDKLLSLYPVGGASNVNQPLRGNITSVQKPLSSVDDYDTYKLFVNAESGGYDKAKNPLSTARGLVQFTEGTWEGDPKKKGTGIRNQVPELANIKFGSPEFYDEKTQKAAFDHLNKQNEAVLIKNKVPVNNVNRYVMWGLGSSDGSKVLSNPEGNFKKSLANPEEVLKANPQFANFKTNQDYINWAEGYLNKKAGVGAGPGRGQINPSAITSATQTNVVPDAVPQESVAVPEKKLEVVDTEIPEIPKGEVPTVEGTGFFQKRNQDKFNMLGVESKKELDTVSQAVARVSQMKGTPEEKKGLLAKTLEGIFGPTGLFSDKELIRFGLVAAGGMLTGGSVGGSLRAAGLSTLQASDRRQAEEAAALKQEKQIAAAEDRQSAQFREYDRRQEAGFREADKRLKRQLDQSLAIHLSNKSGSAAEQAFKDNKNLYSGLIKTDVDLGRITPEVGSQLLRLNSAGRFSEIEGVLGSDKFATPQYKAGLKPTDKPSTFIQEGYTTPKEMYRDPKDQNSLIVIGRDPEGKPIISRVPAKGYREITPTEDTIAAKERQFKDTLLSSHLFGVDEKKGKGVYFDLSKQDAIGQLKTWQNEQRRLDLKDDYTQFAEQINHALDIAAKTKERKPHVGKMLDLLLINSTALTNNDIIIDTATKKMIDPGKLGKLTTDVNLFNEKKLESASAKKEKPTPKEILNSSNEFISKATQHYNSPGDKLSPLQLAEKVGRENPMFNKIKDAPNPYWGYVYYQMAIDKPKKE